MAKMIRLSQTYIHSGTHYGPGAVEVDDAVYADLEAREQALRGPEEATAAPALTQEPEAPSVPRRERKARG